MIHSLLEAFERAAESIQSEDRFHKVLETVSKGVQGILSFGGLDVAVEMMAALSRDGPCSYHRVPKHLEIELRSDIVDDALRIACSGSFDPGQSARYIHFARQIGLGTNVNARAIEMMMNWKAEEVFRICLAEGLDLQSVDEEGRNSLHYAFRTGFYEYFPITELLMMRLDVNVSESAGVTPLHLATSLGLCEIVEQLLAMNAASMAVDGQGCSVLRYAVMSGKLKIVKDITNTFELSRSSHEPSNRAKQEFYISYGNTSGRTPADGRSTLHLGVISQNHDIVSFLLDNKVDVNAKDARGKTALHYAIEVDSYSQSVRFCDTLINAGAQPLIMDNNGIMPLHEAALRSYTNPSATALTGFKGCDPSTFDAHDKAGQTILHKAVKHSADSSVALILELGGSPHILNSLNQNALHVCTQLPARGMRGNPTEKEHKLTRIVNILLDTGVDLFEKDHEGFSPIEYAVTSGNEPLLCHLADHAKLSLTLAPKSEGWIAYQGILTSSWSLAIRGHQWIILGSIFTIDPGFRPDMSLLTEELYGDLFLAVVTLFDGRLKKLRSLYWNELMVLGTSLLDRYFCEDLLIKGAKSQRAKLKDSIFGRDLWILRNEWENSRQRPTRGPDHKPSRDDIRRAQWQGLLFVYSDIRNQNLLEREIQQGG